MTKYPLFRVKKTGLLTSFQDLGRTGYQQFGVPVSGAMDPFALQTANMLLGNKRGEVALEVTMMGPELEVLSPATAVVCGGDLQPKVNGRSVPMWRTFQLTKGDRITFGIRKTGLRAYLSVAGGFDIPAVMGSKSFYGKTGMGTQVKEGSIIGGYKTKSRSGRRLNPSEIPEYPEEVPLRVVCGPHEERFTNEAVATFFNEPHSVTPRFDRAAYRLSSPPMDHKNGADIYSDALPFGGIQVPENGQPILLMADRPATGGYTRIATVISADLPKAAQLAPDDKIHFEAVDVEKAQKIYRKREQFFQKLKRSK